MTVDHGSGDWMDGTHYAEISLGNTLSGEVHVWTQTPEFYNGYEQFDTVLGVVDNSTGKLVASNDDGDPSSGSYMTSEIMNLVTSNSATRSNNGYDSFLSFTANTGTDYSVIVGDLNQNYGQFGGLFDLYAVSNPNQASETLILSETNIGQTNGALVDFSSGITGNYQSAWVTSLGGDGGS